MTNRRFNLCHESSFCADNTVITVVPAFSNDAPLPLLSSQYQQTVGPFVAGMPQQVPLWLAKVLYQRHLAQINVPDWLVPDKLIGTLQEEKQSTTLTTSLPFYYYEIARSLYFCLEKSTMIILQDLANVRIDKIRQNFHTLSREELSQNGGNELPMIAVTGIASIELNTVGPFLQRAFSDYGYLTESSTAKGGGKTLEGEGEEATTFSSSSEKENNSSIRKVATKARSRLRKFRS